MDKKGSSETKKGPREGGKAGWFGSHRTVKKPWSKRKARPQKGPKSDIRNPEGGLSERLGKKKNQFKK